MGCDLLIRVLIFTTKDVVYKIFPFIKARHELSKKLLRDFSLTHSKVPVYKYNNGCYILNEEFVPIECPLTSVRVPISSFRHNSALRILKVCTFMGGTKRPFKEQDSITECVTNFDHRSVMLFKHKKSDERIIIDLDKMSVYEFWQSLVCPYIIINQHKLESDDEDMYWILRSDKKLKMEFSLDEQHMIMEEYGLYIRHNYINVMSPEVFASEKDSWLFDIIKMRYPFLMTNIP